VTDGDPTATDIRPEPSEPKGAVPRRGLFRRFADAPWWVHVLAGIGAVIAVLLTAAVAVAAIFVDISWEHGPLAPDIPKQTEVVGEEARELAERFAPVLRYDSRELFVPISRAAYVSRTELKKQKGKLTPEKIAEAVEEGLLPDKLDDDCQTKCFLFLDVRGVEPKALNHSERAYNAIEDKLLKGKRPTVYYHVTRYDDTDHYAVQYWFLYFFNYRLNEHESDWEQITVHLDENQRPVDVYYSAHEGGNTGAFAKIEVADGEHPVVYPALGSHANYFRPGKHVVEIVCKRLFRTIKHCFDAGDLIADVNDDKGERLAAADYDFDELDGPIYIGSYGSGNYVVLTRKPSVLRDPRLRSAWLDPLGPLT
jgi:hypothetical protein